MRQQNSADENKDDSVSTGAGLRTTDLMKHFSYSDAN